MKQVTEKLMQITHLLHATLLVTDLDRARNFYENLLGLVLDSQRPEMNFPGVWYAINPNQQIHLMQLPNPATGLRRPEHGGRDQHIALAITSLDELAQKLDAAAIHYTISQSGRRALFCRDPSDNALEFIEIPPFP